MIVLYCLSLSRVVFVSHARSCCVRTRAVTVLSVLAVVLCSYRDHVLGSCGAHVRVVLALVCDRVFLPLVLCLCCVCTRAVVVLYLRLCCARPVLALVLSSSCSCRARCVLVLYSRPLSLYCSRARIVIAPVL